MAEKPLKSLNLVKMLLGDPDYKIFYGPGGGCARCPFSLVNNWYEPVNYSDPDEGYYDCTLIGKKRIWGEDPICSEADWNKAALKEVDEFEKVLLDALLS